MTVLAVGNKIPKWINIGLDDYKKRLQHYDFEIIEIPPVKRMKTLSKDKICQLEGERILKKISANMYVVALEVAGKQLSTESLAIQLENWLQITTNLCFVIGGADGLSSDVFQRANQKWSLSLLTFPHPIIRLLVTEQIYRVWSINNNHPYHRAG